MKKLLFGINNPSKLRVFRGYLADMDVCCVSPGELGLTSIPDEGSKSAPGNALEKAKAWHRLSGLPVVTEDSGLLFLDLPKDHPDQPDVMVRRACGHTMDDEEMLAWYQGIVHRHGGQLRAAWEDAWCVLQDDAHFTLHTATPEVLECFAIQLVDVPCATRVPGWPLDSLTYYASIGKYKAELSAEEMRAIYEARGTAPQMHQKALQDWLRSAVAELL